jgi:hypothetical protein
MIFCPGTIQPRPLIEAEDGACYDIAQQKPVFLTDSPEEVAIPNELTERYVCYAFQILDSGSSWSEPPHQISFDQEAKPSTERGVYVLADIFNLPALRLWARASWF